MQRRSFLGGLAATVAGIWLPPEPEIHRVYSFIKRPRGLPMLRIYSGTAPPSADSALSNNTMLSEIPLLQFGEEWKGNDFSADNTGVATFARLYGPDGNTILDLPGEQMGLDSRHIVTGVSISMQLRLGRGLSALLI